VLQVRHLLGIVPERRANGKESLQVHLCREYNETMSYSQHRYWVADYGVDFETWDRKCPNKERPSCALADYCHRNHLRHRCRHLWVSDKILVVDNLLSDNAS